MDLENTGNEWMREAPLLSATDKKNPFSLPDDYFNNLELNIRARCVIEDARFQNEEEFKVPAGYFDSLIQETESRIAEQNIREIAPTAGFSLPDGYFENLQHRISESTSKPVEAVIKPIRAGWIKYAAAACVTAVLGSLLIFNKAEESFESKLSRVPEQELINYLQMHSDIGDTPIILENLGQNVNLADISSDISDAELEEYISTTL